MHHLALIPTRKDRLFFAVILLALGGMLALMMVYRPGLLLGGSIFTSSLLLVSWIAGPQRSLRGPLLPALLLGLFQLAQLPQQSAAAAAATAGVFVLLAIFVALRPAFGNWLYVQWMRAVEPLGWSFSCLLFAAVYFLIFAPIGLVFRLVGYDPLSRRLDPRAASYWVERKPPADIERYFRQF